MTGRNLFQSKLVVCVSCLFGVFHRNILSFDVKEILWLAILQRYSIANYSPLFISLPENIPKRCHQF